MPDMANLVLKNAAGTTVTGTKLTPSAGDTVPAQWRIETAKPPFARCGLNMVARSNAKKDVRRLSGSIKLPYTVTDSTMGVETPLSLPSFSFELVVGTNVPSTTSDDLVAYVASFFQDATVQASMKSQIAPN